MASEDHDFEEINHFHFKGQKVRCESKEKGVVGSFSTKGLDLLLSHFSNALGKSIAAETLKKWFQESYLSHPTLSEATRFLIHQLFGEYGLIILDANDADLKRSMIPYFQKELLENITFKSVSKTNQKLLKALGKNTKIQVNPRKINLFYCKDQQRNRIVEKENYFTVLHTDISFSKQEIVDEMNQYPERFSPNVLLRPLYQEVLLPNLGYIGGAGELSYWFQLKSTFEQFHVPFPILKLRTSALLVSSKQAKKIKKLALSYADLFLESSSLINFRVRAISNIDIDFTPQKETLIRQFQQLYEIAEQTDASFLGAVTAQEKKQLNGLDALEKRLLLAQRRKLTDEVRRISDLQNDLFPNKSLQERQLNFSELYLEYGDELIPMLMQSFDPLHFEYMVLELSQQD
jgi:bacillithiol biosynthesis cysteine-adding enzyme BshC